MNGSCVLSPVSKIETLLDWSFGHRTAGFLSRSLLCGAERLTLMSESNPENQRLLTERTN
jgi:hypothetical protein